MFRFTLVRGLPGSKQLVSLRKTPGEISQSARDLCALWRDRRMANWQEMASFLITGLTFDYRYLTIYVCMYALSMLAKVCRYYLMYVLEDTSYSLEMLC